MRENVGRTIGEAQKEISKEKVKRIPDRVSLRNMISIVKEFRQGFKLLKKYDLSVTFFGSARSSFNDDIYQNAKELAHRLSKDGFTVLTGGGDGIMGAANRGAYEAKGTSVGLNIELPLEQKINKFTTDSLEFKYFFIRKIMLSFASEIYIFFPGGYGTLDEFFEMITLIQTKKIQQVPVILFDKEYWTPLLTWIREVLYEKNHAIDKNDMDIFNLVDSVDEAYAVIIKRMNWK